MSQFNLVAKAERSPGYCMCCGTVTGPFIDLSIPFVKVHTAVGVFDAEGGTYLCVGTEENPGCAVQIGRLTGRLVEATKLRELHEHAATLDSEIAELRGALSKKAIKVDDLIAAGVIRPLVEDSPGVL